MSKNKGQKEYDFELQLEEAQRAEGKLQKILAGSTFELKTERHLWHDTGNIVIEYESHNQPSGIAVTKADYWVHELRSRDNETLAYLMFPTPILRKICNDMMEEGNWRQGGEKSKMKMVLLDLKKVLGRLRHFTGTGDDKFVIRKKSDQ